MNFKVTFYKYKYIVRLHQTIIEIQAYDVHIK